MYRKRFAKSVPDISSILITKKSLYLTLFSSLRSLFVLLISFKRKKPFSTTTSNYKNEHFFTFYIDKFQMIENT